jgi:hypothetical protein
MIVVARGRFKRQVGIVGQVEAADVEHVLKGNLAEPRTRGSRIVTQRNYQMLN